MFATLHFIGNGSLNLFSVTNLQPEVELVYLLPRRYHDKGHWKWCMCRKWPCLCRKGALNSNM